MEECLGLPANPREPEKGEEGSRSSNRWPRHETLALLRLRSEMDAVKVPLWEEVSRKLGELGYKRSAKKCKEKFENIYKYHRRTKGGRSGKQDGKNYRFFEQLEGLDSSNLFMSSASMDNVKTPVAAAAAAGEEQLNYVESTSMSQSSSSSDEESVGMSRRKRKLKEFVEGLLLKVIQKQESLQQKFFETLEKCERDRMAEESWKMQELERIKRERELLARDRSIAAARDAALLSFLQKFSEQGSSVQLPQHLTIPMQFSENQGVQENKAVNTPGGFGVAGSRLSSSRWPKEEIETLIRLRTTLDVTYQDNSSKGPLWEEISAEMKRLGYDRSARRCKEKWENMNKYFKRVKESNKKRPGDSRTCPYFNQLDALYKDKIRKVDDNELKPEELLMQMMGGGQGEGRQPESATTEDRESETMYPNQEESRETEDGNGFDPCSMAFMQC